MLEKENVERKKKEFWVENKGVLSQKEVQKKREKKGNPKREIKTNMIKNTLKIHCKF